MLVRTNNAVILLAHASFPMALTHLHYLTRLILSSQGLTNIPVEIRHMRHLEFLELKGCKKLESVAHQIIETSIRGKILAFMI